MKKRPLCFVCLFFLIIQSIRLISAGGESLKGIPASSIFYEREEKTVFIQGQVYRKTNTSNIQILYLKNNSVNDSNLLVYDDEFTDISIGQTITLRGTTESFETARNPGNYDQALYYARENIYGVIWCDKILKISGEADHFSEGLHQFKMTWKKKLMEVRI